ncbi:lytic transglycosylase domain-containing protein [Agromyces ramosus]|uniref:Membrane-bound lytic murein transglycosylase B n=1 Tax=Agromyces ramosus TaxID=33879 RepID=A0ABU0RCU2_9MICO|nr:lytic transglycosylase domain-containing protein [Agromyces ramosus]MDQ0894879.1 membrane-bound lytic murein transglycosylase B [Agromyces ramosus]
MSWDDDSDADDYDGRRPERATGRAAAWRVTRRVLGYAGVVAGVGALVVGTIFAANVVGLAAKPGGFEAPGAKGPSVELPPVTLTPEQDEAADEQLPTNEESAPVSSSAGSLMPGIDPEWATVTAAATGIPERALTAYAFAHVSIADEQPECGLAWITIAAIGEIESGHGSHGDTILDENGHAQPAIIGRALDGDGVAKIEDTDDGVLDGDDKWDRAVGPMQFIPSTWEKWASDANGDDVADPNQIDDAALATARYLCASGPMTSVEGWRAAVFSYNHDNDYVDKVAQVANEFAAAVE